jgi:hypothetical protein
MHSKIVLMERRIARQAYGVQFIVGVAGPVRVLVPGGGGGDVQGSG